MAWADVHQTMKGSYMREFFDFASDDDYDVAGLTKKLWDVAWDFFIVYSKERSFHVKNRIFGSPRLFYKQKNPILKTIRAISGCKICQSTIDWLSNVPKILSSSSIFEKESVK